jgi:hypothetical protein
MPQKTLQKAFLRALWRSSARQSLTEAGKTPDF